MCNVMMREKKIKMFEYSIRTAVKRNVAVTAVVMYQVQRILCVTGTSYGGRRFPPRGATTFVPL